MNASTQNQLRALDRAILALVDERARLLADVAGTDPRRGSSVDDLLRRYSGALAAGSIQEIFASIDRATLPATRGEEQP